MLKCCAVGIFPYILKLLQTSATDLRQTLVFIWVKILSWDMNPHVQNDLVKDGGYLYFIKHLESRDIAAPYESRAQAAFVLAAICNKNPKAQLLCAQSGLLQVYWSQLDEITQKHESNKKEMSDSIRLFVKWLLICLGRLYEDVVEIIEVVFEHGIHNTVLGFLQNNDPEIRAAAIFALGNMFSIDMKREVKYDENPLYNIIIDKMFPCIYDASPLVRWELCRSLSRVAFGCTAWTEIRMVTREGIDFIDRVHTSRRQKDGESDSIVDHSDKEKQDRQMVVGEETVSDKECYQGAVQTERKQMADKVISGLLFLSKDPLTKIGTQAQEALLACGAEELDQDTSMGQNRRARRNFEQNINKSVPLSGMTSFLPKSWQTRSQRDLIEHSSQSLPYKLSQNLMGNQEEINNSETMSESGMGKGDVGGAIEKKVPIPNSVLYSISCKQFQWPLLYPLSNEEPGVPWAKPCPPGKLKQRTELKDSGLEKCSSKHLKVKLREQVHAINTGARSTEALLLEPFKPHVIVGDRDGRIRVCDYLHSRTINEFQGTPQLNFEKNPIVDLYRLNDLHHEILLSCSSTGAIMAWRHYSKPAEQMLASCWQSIRPSVRLMKIQSGSHSG